MHLRITALLAVNLASFPAFQVLAQEIPANVSAKCSLCHPIPRPASMPRYAWPRINNGMADLMKVAEIPFTEQEYRDITQWYVANSPERLALIPDDLEEPKLAFEKSSVGLIRFDERPQATSLKFTDLDGDGLENDLVVTDNNMSAVSRLQLEDGAWKETVLAEVPAPVNSTPFDFDGDGDIDLAISSMGFMHPNDDLIGEFHVLVNQGGGKFEQRILLKGVPRITDCAPADWDGDGDIDFVIALFGWRYTGMIGLLRQNDGGTFALEMILSVNGAMRVIRNDANGDEAPDFVALITQQHEAIVQFTNSGDGSFENKYIARANHPAFGSSSIYLHDLDQDGDEDMLYTNGDMMDDNPEPKPYHGVRWLENDGKGSYELHYLAAMPGCYDAKPVDLDGDGDLDVVYAALYFQWDQHDFPSLAWLENTGGFENFVRRRISYAPTNLANIAIGDANGDGKPDIFGGGMHVPGPLERKARLTVWIQK